MLVVKKMNTEDIKSIIQEAISNASKKTGKPKRVSKKTLKKVNSPSVVSFASGVDTHAQLDDVTNWTNKDFSFYIKKIYLKRYNEDWIPTVLNLQVYMNRVKEDLQNVLGFCDNIAFKDYVDYLFGNWLDSVREKSKGDVYISALRDEKAMVDFVSSYDYPQRVKFYLKKTDDSSSKNESPAMMEMEQSYLLGIENLVMEYGIVLSVNFLHFYHDFGVREAANSVAKAFFVLYSKGKWEKAKEATVKNSPYPNWFKFKKYEAILDAINKKIDTPVTLDVVFNDNKENYDFLRSAK